MTSCRRCEPLLPPCRATLSAVRRAFAALLAERVISTMCTLGAQAGLDLLAVCALQPAVLNDEAFTRRILQHVEAAVGRGWSRKGEKALEAIALANAMALAEDPAAAEAAARAIANVRPPRAFLPSSLHQQLARAESHGCHRPPWHRW